MIEVADFRTVFPEFADAATFPDARIAFWLRASETTLPPLAWGGTWEHAVLLLAAHQLALGLRRAAVVMRVGPGAAGAGAGGFAPVSSKSVGGVSVAYDNSLGTIEGAGTYNLTPYGVEFWQLLQMLPASGMQL